MSEKSLNARDCFENKYSYMKIIIVLVTGTAFFVVLKITRILLDRISHKYSYWHKLNKVYPAIGNTIWTVFVFWGVGLLLKGSIYYPYIVAGMVLVIMGLITWFFIRDVFAGALFKMQNDLNQGDYIKIGDISGQVKSSRLTHLEITSDNGQTIKIPNTRLNQEFISGSTTPEGMEEFNIQLLIDKKFTKPEIEEKITHELANSPWCNYKNPPVIKLKDEDNNSYTYDVQVYTLNHQHLRMVEKTLENKFENRKQ
jgi:small-conductance mechanosensitive channel